MGQMNTVIVNLEESHQTNITRLTSELDEAKDSVKSLKAQLAQSNRNLQTQLRTQQEKDKKKVGALERQNRLLQRELGNNHPLVVAINAEKEASTVEESVESDEEVQVSMPRPESVPSCDSSSLLDGEETVSESSSAEDEPEEEFDAASASECEEESKEEEFVPEKTKKKAPARRKRRTGKQTPKTIGRKRTSFDFFSMAPSSDQPGDVSPTPFMAIDQVKPLSKRKRIVAAIPDLSSDSESDEPPAKLRRSKPTAPRPKKEILKGIFQSNSSRFGAKLRIEEDKENAFVI